MCTQANTPQLYPTKDAPRYVMGHAYSMAMVAMSTAIFLFLWLHFRNANQRKLQGKEDHRIAGLTEEEAEELGEHNPKYMYTY